MILTALNDYYNRVAGSGEDAPPPYGFAVQKVSGAIQLAPDGRFLGIVPLQDKDAKGRDRPRPMAVPEVGIRPGKQIKPAFLCDTAAFLLGYDIDGKQRAATKFPASAAHHQDLLLSAAHDPAAKAVLAHFATWNPAVAADILTPYTDLLQGWLVFLVDGRFAHDVPAVRMAWLRHFQAAGADLVGQCLVSGESDAPIARLHPNFKGVPGAQSSGASLVSFNFPAAESYGKTQSFNAPVSEAAAFGYGAALNHLLRPETGRRRIIGDMAVVMWAERGCAAENLLLDLADPGDLSPDEDAPPEDKARAAAVRDALERMAQGQLPIGFEADAGVRFHVLGLSPNAARLSVRLWLTDSLGELVERIGRHQQDLALVTDKRSPHPSLWVLANETRPKDADGRARGRGDDGLSKLRGDLLRAVLTGGAYPATLLPILLARFRADAHVTHPRVALLKALINRNRRINNHEREELPVALDDTRSETGYLLGRLFAALERLQEAAHGGDRNRTIRDKFLGSAAATPRSAFNHLLTLSEAHRRKGRRDNTGAAIRADKVISRMMAELTEIPAVLPPDEQALFFLGYYQQRQDFFTKRAENVAEAV